MSLEDAKKMGAMALFSDKYKDVVRVVKIGPSVELCGGTHIRSTSDIKKFAILGVESKGANLYRLEATTNENVEKLIGKACLQFTNEINRELLIKETRECVEYCPFDIYTKKYGIQSEVKKLEKKYQEEKSKLFSSNIDSYLNDKTTINGVESVITKLDNADMSSLKDLIDKIANSLKDGFVFLINVNGSN